jgi:hypothetical protein
MQKPLVTQVDKERRAKESPGDKECALTYKL